MKEEDLFKWNEEGIIPGPNETEEEFFLRANYCSHLKETLPSQLSIPNACSFPTSDLIQEASFLTKPLFDISPNWIPIIFSNHKLAPWHGGAAWIFQMTPEYPTAAFFQLRTVFAKKKRFLFYDRSEIIAHETAHVGRMLFNEPKFEEILAYRTSSSRFRRYLGPIVQHPYESIIFILLLFFVMILSAFLPLDYDPFYLISFIEYSPFLWLILGCLRLVIRQKQFSKCLKNLNAMLQSEEAANGVIFRLSDQEILLFSRGKENILEYVDLNKNSSIRWKLIYSKYLINKVLQKTN